MSITNIWLFSSIASVLLLIFNLKQDLRDLDDIFDCMMFVLLIFVFCISGPIGLALILAASAIRFIVFLLP